MIDDLDDFFKDILKEKTPEELQDKEMHNKKFNDFINKRLRADIRIEKIEKIYQNKK